MIERYCARQLVEIWCDANKVYNWQKVELAVIESRARLKQMSRRDFNKIRNILEQNPVNLKKWYRMEHILRHDLNAFVEERKSKLPVELRRYFHHVITSYDTEEPAFALMLNESIEIILEKIFQLEQVLVGMAQKYRYTIMNGRTHGQEAELQSFGKRCLTWLAQLRVGLGLLVSSKITQSKLSGAIGNYGGMSPDLEKNALEILGFKPFYGATQIMPREVYAPVAQALCIVAGSVDKISTDIRLMARSGLPLMQEPFGKLQTGSSAMPHKKNTIATEKDGGMNRVAQACGLVANLNISTWEERAIEQSSAERIMWPDLFHTVNHALETLTKVLSKANVYPDNMLVEVVNSRGCYAAALAKDFLKEHGEAVGISSDDAYRIVQLAAFNVFEPDDWAKNVRENVPSSLAMADVALKGALQRKVPEETLSIRNEILAGRLRVCSSLAPTERKVGRWNKALQRLFSHSGLEAQWLNLFMPSHILKHEAVLYQKIIGV